MAATLALGSSGAAEQAVPALLAYLRSGRKDATEPVLERLARQDPDPSFKLVAATSAEALRALP